MPGVRNALRNLSIKFLRSNTGPTPTVCQAMRIADRCQHGIYLTPSASIRCAQEYRFTPIGRPWFPHAVVNLPGGKKNRDKGQQLLQGQQVYQISQTKRQDLSTGHSSIIPILPTAQYSNTICRPHQHNCNRHPRQQGYNMTNPTPEVIDTSSKAGLLFIYTL